MEGINKVVILGGGETGKRIRDLFFKAGLKVVMPDLETDYLKELADADIVLEALRGDVESRKETLRRCDEKAPPKTIFATAASWGITEMAAATKRPEKTLGLNFTFNLVEGKCLVQIVKQLETSEETVQACKSLIEKVGATAVEVEDSPGFILDRVMASMINEAATMYASRIATMEDMDKVAKLCLNWPMGPFEFADTIGIDNVVATLETLSQQKGSQYIPCRLLRQMVALGRLGKKTGKGFYQYI